MGASKGEEMKRSILIVDDEPNVAFFLSRSLEHSNLAYQTTVTHSGEEAIRLLQASDPPFDLLIADLRLPGISGLELIRQTRVLSPATRTILITAYGSERVKARARQLGANRYITKPFDIERFLSAVQEALSPSSEERELAEEQRLRDLAVSWIFHKLRVPLTFVTSYADILAEQAGDEQTGKITQEIRRYSQEMRGAIDDFTLLGEWTIGQMPGYRQKVELSQLIETIVAQLSALALEREQSLTMEQPTEPLEITGDRLALGILLTALIVSGMKSLPRHSRVVVRATRQGAQVLITVICTDCEEEAGEATPYEHGLSTTVARSLAEGLGGKFEMSPAGSAREWRCDLWLPNAS